jgi:hypothetical protein
MGDKYIRRPAVFHKYSERDMRIWNWASKKTHEFKNYSFAAFVRDKLEWCMMNEGNEFKKAEPIEEQPENNGGWGNLI